MDTERRRDARAPRRDPLDGRADRPRRHPARLGGGLLAALAALTAGSGARPQQSEETSYRERAGALASRPYDEFVAGALALLEEMEPRLAASAEARGAHAWLCVGLLMGAELERELPVLRWYEAGHGALVAAGESATAAGLGCAAADRLLRESRASDALRVVDASLTACPAELEHHALLRLARAEALRLLGNWRAAERELAILEDELPAADAQDWERPPDWVRARLHGARCQILLEVGLLAEARRELDEEGRIARALGDPGLLVGHAARRADHLLRTEDFAGLLRALEDLEAAIEPSSVPPPLATLLDLHEAVALAALARVDGRRAPPAVAALEACLAGGRLSPLQRNRALRTLADLANARGDAGRAAEFAARARAELDALPAGSVPVEATAQTLACEARIALAAGAGQDELERLRSTLHAAFARQLDVWAEVSRPPGGLDFLGTADRRDVAVELVRLTLRAGLECPRERALEVLLELQARGSVALAAEFDGTDLAEIRDAVLTGPEHGALFLLPGSRRLVVLAVDRGGVEAFEVADHARLRQSLRGVAGRLVHHLSPSGHGDPSARRRAAEILDACRALADRLLPGELRERMERWRRLTVVGAGFLEGVPPEALALEDGRLVGERWAVDELPTLPLGVLLARRTPVERGDASELAVVGSLEPAADLRERFPGLWVHDLGPADVAPLVGGLDPGRVRLELDATPSRVRALDLAGVPVVHFLCHGVFDPARSRGAALALAPDSAGDSLLACEDIERLELSGLVVLSACGAALGPRRVGEDDLAHLGSAVLAAGARAVVLTRAPLEFGRSLALFARFHAELRGGASPAESLRRARAAQPADDPWARLEAAHLQVVGRGQVPIDPTAASR